MDNVWVRIHDDGYWVCCVALNHR